MIAPLACVLPAYQAGRTLARVVAGLRASLPDALVIVVDDGSTDHTGEVARACGDAVLVFTRNQGKGAALRAGAGYALAGGAAAILTVDADGQHDPAAAPALVSALDGADLAIGVRERAGSSMPWPRRLTNRVSALAVSACARRSVRDPQSGYRAYRRAVLERVQGVGDRYDYESDLLLRALRAGYEVAQVPVPTIYGAPSHFLPIADTARIVRTIWKHRAGVLGNRTGTGGGAAGASASLPSGCGF